MAASELGRGETSLQMCGVAWLEAEPSGGVHSGLEQARLGPVGEEVGPEGCWGVWNLEARSA